MKVLQINLGKQFGGAEIVVTNLVKGLSKKHETFLLIRKGSLYDSRISESNSIKKIYRINLESVIYYISGFINTIKFIKKEDIEMVHSHGILANLFAVCLKLIAFRKVKIVTTVHSSSKYDRDSKLRNFIFNKIERFCLNRNDLIFTVSEFLKSELVDSGLSGEKIKVIYNGIDIDNGDCNKNEQIEESNKGYFKVGGIGRLEEIKGFKYLIDSIKEVENNIPSIKCEIIGEGSQYDDLKQQIIKLGLQEKVYLTGYIENINDKIKELDLIVVPSIMDGLNLVIIESLLLGKPVIATRVGGIVEIIENQKEGLLVNSRDIKEIASSILYLYSNQDLSKKLAYNGQMKIKNKFNNSSMLAKVEKYYKELINNK